MYGRRSSLWLPLPLLLPLLLLAATAADAGVYRLLVLHTNDMHARFDQTDRTGSACAAAAGPCYGGFARVRTAVRRGRAEARAAGAASLFLNAGDTFQGSAFYTYLKWKSVSRMIQRIDVDVMSLGNHEFDDGVKDLQMFLHSIRIPVVASNLDYSTEPLLANETILVKSKVLTVNGRRIGIIGYLTPETALTSILGNVKILPEIPSINAEAKRLKNEGVNVLIALGHSGFETDVQIAEQVEDIDLVIGGHTNTFLYTGNPPDIEIPSGSYPYIVEQPRTRRKVPVIQAFYMTKYLGKLWIDIDEAGEIIATHGNPVLLDSSVEQDPELVNEVKELEKMMKYANTMEVIGSTSVFLQGINEHCRFKECNLGNLVTDAFVDYNVRANIKSFDLTKQWTDAPIAILQGGGIRANINHLNENGSVTMSDIVTAFPFNNDMGKVTVKGSDIWSMLESSVHRYSQVNGRGEFLQVSGLKIVIDLSQPANKRVQSVQARCATCVVPVYKPLDLNANYTLIMNIFLALGGDGIQLDISRKYQSLNITEFEILKREFQLKSPVHPGIEDRIILLNAELLSISNSQQISTPLSNLTLLLTMVIISSTYVL